MGDRICVDTRGAKVMAIGVDQYNQALTGENAATLGVNCGLTTGRNALLVMGIDVYNQAATGEVSKTLRAGKTDADAVPCAVLAIGDEKDAEALLGLIKEASSEGGGIIAAKNDEGRERPIGAINATDHKGARNQWLDENKLILTYAVGNGQADQLRLHEIAGALNCMHDEQAVLCAYCLQGNGIDRSDKAGCNGAGVAEEVGYTLNTIDRHAVCFCVATQQGGAEIMRDKSPTITASAGMSGNNQPWICKAAECWAKRITLIVRRLTPTECARLQGMPDYWDANAGGKDAPRYKMWGNGMALPNVLYVFEGFAEISQREN